MRIIRKQKPQIFFNEEENSVKVENKYSVMSACIAIPKLYDACICKRLSYFITGSDCITNTYISLDFLVQSAPEQQSLAIIFAAAASSLVLFLGLATFFVNRRRFIGLFVGVHFSNLLRGTPLEVMVRQTNRQTAPEGTNLQDCTFAGPPKGLEQDKGKVLVREEIVRDFPDSFGFTPDFFKFVHATGKETNGQKQSQTSHAKTEPELLFHVVIGNVNAQSETDAHRETNDGTNRNRLEVGVLQKEGEEKDTTFGNFTPEVPPDVKVNLLVVEIIQRLCRLGFILLPGQDGYLLVGTQEDRDLDGELDDADSSHDFRDTFDDFDHLFIQLVGKDGQWNRHGNDDEHHKGRGHRGRQAHGLEGFHLAILRHVFTPFYDGTVLTDNDTSFQDFTGKNHRNGRVEETVAVERRSEVTMRMPSRWRHLAAQAVARLEQQHFLHTCPLHRRCLRSSVERKCSC